MAEQGTNDEQDLLPDGPAEDAEGAGERDQGVEDITEVGIGSDITSGDQGADEGTGDPEGFEGA